MNEPVIDLGEITSQLIRDATKDGLEKLIREKFRAAGVRVRLASIRKVVEQIMSGEEDITFGEAKADEVPVEISDEELNAVMDRVEQFAKNDIPEIIKEVSDKAAEQLYADLEKKWAKEHRQQKVDLAMFQKNLEVRYGSGLDKLRILATIAREWGQENYQRKFAQGNGVLSHRDDVLINLHVRGCQVLLEILTLLETGLADGAMARWRTLHEITTVGMLIDKHGEELAQRYVEYQIVESKKAITAYEACHEKLGYEPYPEEEVASIRSQYAVLIDKYGKEFGKEYGWAAHLLGEGPNKQVKFVTLEKAVGMKMMRAHYQMACYNVHASPKGIYFKLGQIERSETLLAGSSNAGLVEPAQNAALSLGKLTMLVCLDKDGPPFDNNVFAKVVNRLMNEIPRDFAAADSLLKRDHLRSKEVDEGE